MNNTAVILLAQGVQDEEAIYPIYRLQEAGLIVHKISSGPIYTKNGKTGVFGKYGIPFIPDDSSENLWKYTPDIIIIPGGWQCPEILRMDQHVLSFVYKQNIANTIIGVICHGAWVLISAGICDDRLISGFEGIRYDILNAGAEYRENLTIDGNIISAPHYKDNPSWMKAVLDKHELNQLADRIIH